MAGLPSHFYPPPFPQPLKRRCWQFLGLGLVGASAIIGAAILTYAPGDPSLNSVTDNQPINLAGQWGAIFADLTLQLIGYAALMIPAVLFVWAALVLTHGTLAKPLGRLGLADPLQLF